MVDELPRGRLDMFPSTRCSSLWMLTHHRLYIDTQCVHRALFIIRKRNRKNTLKHYSARALVKKTQEPGIKLQKADFFRNDTWTSPQTNSEDAPKIPLVHFFYFKMAATM